MTTALRDRSLNQHFFGEGPKRILALDGGGVRGILTCGVLEQMEKQLAARLPENERDDFRLCHYFDLIAGTSTGAIMSTLLAMGYRVSEIKQLYRKLAKQVFGKKRRGIVGFVPIFDSKNLTRVINETFEDFQRTHGGDPSQRVPLGTDYLKTGLLICSKRIDKGSPWVLTNNPHSKYWEWNSPVWQGYYAENGGPGAQYISNKFYNLQEVVQASASAPFYLSPVEKQISEDETGLFFDGGVSPHNNPSMQGFLVATAKWRKNAKPWKGWSGMPRSPWGFGWETGADKIMMVSLGTGAFRPTFTVEDFRGRMAGMKALDALRGMIPDTSTNGLTWLQAISDPPFPVKINSEIDDMLDMGISQDPLLHFQRIDVDLDEKSLRALLGDDIFEGDGFLKDYPQEGPEGLIKDLRELANSADTNMMRLETIGDALGAYWFGEGSNGQQPSPTGMETDKAPVDLIFPEAFDKA